MAGAVSSRQDDHLKLLKSTSSCPAAGAPQGILCVESQRHTRFGGKGCRHVRRKRSGHQADSPRPLPDQCQCRHQVRLCIVRGESYILAFKFELKSESKCLSIIKAGSSLPQGDMNHAALSTHAHPCIVQLRSVILTPSHLAMVTEFAECGDLSGALSEPHVYHKVCPLQASLPDAIEKLHVQHKSDACGWKSTTSGISRHQGLFIGHATVNTLHVGPRHARDRSPPHLPATASGVGFRLGAPLRHCSD